LADAVKLSNLSGGEVENSQVGGVEVVRGYLSISLLVKRRRLQAQEYIVVFIRLCLHNSIKAFLIVNTQAVNINVVFAFRQAYMYLVLGIGIKHLPDYARTTKIVPVEYHEN
jgi:hypothetical protein